MHCRAALQSLAIAAFVAVHAPGARAAAPDAETEAEAERPVVTGVELGEFLLKEYHPIRGERSTLQFSLYAVVPSEKEKAFRAALENRKQKVRDQVTTAVRQLELSDFDDPQLVRVRRRIQLRLHRALPELQLDDVLITQFSFSVER